jgi:hypothetical protein
MKAYVEKLVYNKVEMNFNIFMFLLYHFNPFIKQYYK